jgi:hypothetical protein
LATSSFLEDFFDVPGGDIASLGLVESDLQVSPKLVFHQSTKLIPADQHVSLLRAIVLDLNRPAVPALDRLSLFFGEFRSHGPIISCSSVVVDFAKPFVPSAAGRGLIHRPSLRIRLAVMMARSAWAALADLAGISGEESPLAFCGC